MTDTDEVAAVATTGTVIGVDLGTTSTKSVAYRMRGSGVETGATHAVEYPLHEPHPGYAEQDPEQILDAVVQSIRAVAEQSADVVAICFSTAMHSLIGLDPDGAPITASITWADSRASAQAERLRASPAGLPLHRRTGTPIHPMSPLIKLMWLREQEPERFARVAHWVGIKDFVVSRLCEALVTDHSVASGTGLMNIHTLAWDPEALQLAGIDVLHLPELRPTTAVLPPLVDPAALGVPPGTQVVLGAGDGPLANLGLGAVTPGVAACSIGTSGAMRVMVSKPAVDPHGGVFCYALTPGHWTVGGAINNGGVVLEWTGDALAPDLGEHPHEQLLDAAASVPPGCGGLIMLPYLLSERAPHWSSIPRGAYVGLTREHRRAHLVRAALEGVCQQLALVLRSVRGAGNEVTAVRATGGFARSALWRQMLADTLDMPVEFPSGHEGSSFGAALLAMQALGMIDSIEVAAELVQIADVVGPDPATAEVYRSLQPVFAELYGSLVPAFLSLRRLAPGLPLEAPGSEVNDRP